MCFNMNCAKKYELGYAYAFGSVEHSLSILQVALWSGLCHQKYDQWQPLLTHPFFLKLKELGSVLGLSNSRRTFVQPLEKRGVMCLVSKELA